MICNHISVRNFRNIREADVSFSDGVNILHGRNAQGKTNLLEAIHLISVGRSFRGAKDAEMIGFEAESAQISVDFTDDTRFSLDNQAEMLYNMQCIFFFVNKIPI